MASVAETMESGAVFSPCRTYRYQLTRRWGDGPSLNVIGLNPSTADETVNDPTIRRCIGFAKAWGYAGLVMTNLCAFRATNPKALSVADDPVGPENWDRIVQVAHEADRVLAAWGADLMGVWSWSHVRLRFPYEQQFWCLGLTKNGAPRHPLYVPKATQPIRFEASR